MSDERQGASTKREKRIKYYVTTQVKEFESKKDIEQWLAEHRPTQETKIIRGVPTSHKVVENIVIG